MWQEVGRNSKSALTRQTSILSAKYGIKAGLKAFLEENTSLLRAAGNSRANGISGQEFSSAQLLCTCVPPGSSKHAQNIPVYDLIVLSSGSVSLDQWCWEEHFHISELPTLICNYPANCPLTALSWKMMMPFPRDIKGFHFCCSAFFSISKLPKDSCYLTYGAYTICSVEVLLQKWYKPILIRFMGNLPEANSSQLQLQSTPEIKGRQQKELSFFQHEI